MVQETVDENGPVRRDAYSSLHVSGHAFFVIYDFHPSSAKHIGRAHHNRITDSFCNRKSLLHSGSHAGFRHGDLQLIHHGAELIAVFCQIYDSGGGAKDAHSVFLQF